MQTDTNDDTEAQGRIAATRTGADRRRGERHGWQESSKPHRDCGGRVIYRCIDDDYGDYRLRCLKCNQTWVEEGADA